MLADNKRVANHIKRTSTLIIDEISMLSAETFTTVEQVCRTIRGSQAPFGGLQVILVGDFFQLPPIVRRVEVSDNQSLFGDDLDQTSPFAFNSPAWRELDSTVCYLLEQHRQEDLEFLEALNAIRANNVTQETRNTLTARFISSLPAEIATKLFPHNADVDRINATELNKLPDSPNVYTMTSRGAPPIIESLKRNCLSPELLQLKVGAKVMFTKNHPEGRYVNGTLGTVMSFETNGDPIIKTFHGKTIVVEPTEWAIQDNAREIAAISQFPLRLAWAITVHKSQGMSLDAAVIDLRQAFEYGQGYVALSRLRTLAGLYLLGFNDRALEVHPEVSAADDQFRSTSKRAVQKLASLDPAELVSQQRQFIKDSGGEIGIGSVQPKPKIATTEVTRQLLVDKKLSLTAIAKERGMTVGTIIAHLEKLVEENILNPTKDLAKLKPKSDRFQPIKTALLAVQAKEGQMFLSQTRERLGREYSFDEIRLVRLFL